MIADSKFATATESVMLQSPMKTVTLLDRYGEDCGRLRLGDSGKGCLAAASAFKSANNDSCSALSVGVGGVHEGWIRCERCEGWRRSRSQS